MPSVHSVYPKGSAARTHEEALQLICCSCSRKCKDLKTKKFTRVIDERFEILVKKFRDPCYSRSSPGHPTALCHTCKLVLLAHEKVNNIQCSLMILK